jgi:hypothetical protein
LENGVEAKIASFENVYSVDINWISMEDILQPTNYVEHSRLILWDIVGHLFIKNAQNTMGTRGTPE